MRFNHLNIPDQWNTYFSKYPNGYTMLEALMEWVTQNNNMIDYINNLLTTSLEKPLHDKLNEMALSGELGALITDLIVIDGGYF